MSIINKELDQTRVMWQLGHAMVSVGIMIIWVGVGGLIALLLAERSLERAKEASDIFTAYFWTKLQVNTALLVFLFLQIGVIALVDYTFSRKSDRLQTGDAISRQGSLLIALIPAVGTLLALLCESGLGMLMAVLGSAAVRSVYKVSFSVASFLHFFTMLFLLMIWLPTVGDYHLGEEELPFLLDIPHLKNEVYVEYVGTVEKQSRGHFLTEEGYYIRTVPGTMDRELSDYHTYRIVHLPYSGLVKSYEELKVH